MIGPPSETWSRFIHPTIRFEGGGGRINALCSAVHLAALRSCIINHKPTTNLLSSCLKCEMSRLWEYNLSHHFISAENLIAPFNLFSDKVRAGCWLLVAGYEIRLGKEINDTLTLRNAFMKPSSMIFKIFKSFDMGAHCPYILQVLVQ